jgi:hypothetical protein
VGGAYGQAEALERPAPGLDVRGVGVDQGTVDIERSFRARPWSKLARRGSRERREGQEGWEGWEG